MGIFIYAKKENVHLDEQYFDVIDSKTENGIRKVPIADKMLPFYQSWYDSCPEREYLLHNKKGKGFKYDNYYRVYWTPLMEQLGIERHTVPDIPQSQCYQKQRCRKLP